MVQPTSPSNSLLELWAWALVSADLARGLAWDYRIHENRSQEASNGRIWLAKAFLVTRVEEIELKTYESWVFDAFLIHAHTKAVKRTTSLAIKMRPCLSPRHQVWSPSPSHQEKRSRHGKQRDKPPKLSPAAHQEIHSSLVLKAFAVHLNSPPDPKGGALIQAFVWPYALRVAPYQTQPEEWIFLNLVEHH